METGVAMPFAMRSMLTAAATAVASSLTTDASDTGRAQMDPHAYTALPIAAARAISTERNAGVSDPLARKLVSRAYVWCAWCASVACNTSCVYYLCYAVMRMHQVAGEDQLLRAGANVGYMTKRALIGDELVLEQHRNGTRQVVSLGAGMDSRASGALLFCQIFVFIPDTGRQQDLSGGLVCSYARS